MTTLNHPPAAFSNAPMIAKHVEHTFDHGAISGFNAWFFTAFARYINYIARPHKERAFADLTAGTVLEIGAGTGANLGVLAPGTDLIAVEPSARMHDRLRARSAEAGVNVTVLGTGAEAIPVPDASVDEVICSLVLCTVPDPDRALAEIRRVLRPGGRFRFVEHVAGHPRGLRYALQRTVRRPWGWLFEGCDPSRHTAETVERAGFASVMVERLRFRRSFFVPVNSAIWGIAVR